MTEFKVSPLQWLATTFGLGHPLPDDDLEEWTSLDNLPGVVSIGDISGRNEIRCLVFTSPAHAALILEILSRSREDVERECRERLGME